MARGLPCERIVTWSVLPLISVVDPHTFNSGGAYFLDPRQRYFISRKELLLRFTEVPFTHPQAPVISVSTSTPLYFLPPFRETIRQYILGQSCSYGSQRYVRFGRLALDTDSISNAHSGAGMAL